MTPTLNALLPPPVAPHEVYEMRETTGEGMMECKRRLEHDRTSLMIKKYVETQDPELLAHILERLLGPRVNDW